MVRDDGKESVTCYEVIECFRGYSLVELDLKTGRTHQIRVHMAYIQHPVVGDPLYGRRRLKDDLGLTRQFLHSYSLSLDHPVTGDRIELTDPLPSDLASALRGVSDRTDGRTEFGETVVPAISPTTA
jgi:23S rRNA pseudouridine1911/1915/1917 synthase